MNRVIDKSKTLLVDGPASVTLLSGEVEVFGALIKIGTKIVIRDSKRLPFKVNAKAEFDLTLGEKAVVKEVEGSTVPISWIKAVEKVLGREKPVTVIVIGGVNSGKNSLCLYLANRSLNERCSVTIIDSDLGQSDFNPPSTIGYCRLTRPVLDLFNIRAESVFFIGATNPSSVTSKVVEGIINVKAKALKRVVDVLIVNTDGWIEGEEATRYKIALVQQIKPDLVLGIQQQSELTFLLGAITGTQKLVVATPSVVHKRKREERTLLRELGYKKYLKGARAESFPLCWLIIGNFVFGTGLPSSRDYLKKIEESLKATPVYCEETPDFVLIVLDEKELVIEDFAKDLEQNLNKKVKIIRVGDEKGLIVAIYDAKNVFLGIGILESIDYTRRFIRVYTSVRKDVAHLYLGQVKLDRKGREIGLNEVFPHYV